jgi:ABC-type bacteriocin/lantibiotic exporter with double-glycine peptidase domain
LSQIRHLKANAAEHHIYSRTSELMAKALNAQLKGTGAGILIGVLTSLVRVGGAGLFSWFGWTLILNRSITLGDFMAFTAYVGYLTGPIGQLAGLFTEFQLSAVALARTFEYLDTPVEQDPTSAYSPPLPIQQTIRGHIALQNVSFAYAEDQPVLRDLTLDIPAGQVTAVVGPTGVGKSSLLRLLCRMIDPDDGVILIDGHRLDSFPLVDLRRQIGIVWQEFSLMRGSVWENLTMGIHSPGRQRVEDAVRICQLEDFIQAMPVGYDTPVAEWGATLSGGQRQRIAIARALIRDTPVLLLDEPTSNMDAQTEELLLRALFESTRDKTLLFVTHRIATAAAADQICILKEGRISAIGQHKVLAAENLEYRELLRAAGTARDERTWRLSPL